MDFFKTIFASKYGDGAVALNGSLFDTLLGKSLGGDTPTPVMPSKGDIIAVDMNGDGTAENYLVLKEVSEGVYELLARENSGNGAWGPYSDSYQYALQSTIQTALNITYYNTLSQTAKDAIVDKTFAQGAWKLDASGTPAYVGIKEGSVEYALSVYSATAGSVPNAHVYALSVQDIIDYLGVTPEMTSENTTLTATNLRQMFNLNRSGYIWLASYFDNYPSGNSVYVIYAYNGEITKISAKPPNVSSHYYRPAFQLDLTKIEWTPVEA